MRASLRLLLATTLITTHGAALPDPGAGPGDGNTLQPAPPNPSLPGARLFEEGMGTREPAAHSPSGKLYRLPFDPGEPAEAPKAGWTITGFGELGFLGLDGDDHNQVFRAYKHVREGLFVNAIVLAAERPDQARFVEAWAGGVGQRDQFYRARFGRYNDWKATAFFDSTPHAFTTTYRSLWTGIGTGNLELVALAPGGTTNAATTQAAVEAAVLGTPYSEVGLTREKAGVRLDKRLTDEWRAYASFTDERRKGARPFGAAFGGGGGGGNVEVPESIDYGTRDFAAGLQYADGVSSLNLRASASYFRNGVDTMVFQNPLFISLNGSSGLSATTFTHGRFDQPPDNEHYNVKAEYARALPQFLRGNFTASVALGTMRQDDPLVAPTPFSLAGGTVSAGGASLADAWNTPEALSRRTAGARIDTTLVDLGLALRPAADLNVRGKVRYYAADNALEYIACNPLTGQWGRILNEGSGLSLVGAHGGAGVNPAGTSYNAFNAAGCDLQAARALGIVPATGNVPIASVPYDHEQVLASVTADYRLGRGRSLEAILERDAVRRDFRERDETRDDRVKLTYVDRASLDGTLRLSYEHARRGGGAYDPDPYTAFYSASLGPAPAAEGAAVQSWFRTFSQFRSYDLADRRVDTLNARIDYAIRPDLDASIAARLAEADYPATYGRTGRQRSESFNADVTWQPGAATLVYGFYSYQAARMVQRGLQSNACQVGQTYYFFSNGRVLGAATGAAPPATPEGATLLGTRTVTVANWFDACASAGPMSPLFPESRAWDVHHRDRHHVAGIGTQLDFGKARLEASFTRALGRTRIRYDYDPVALGMSEEQAAIAGAGLPDLTFAQSVLEASVIVPVSPRLAVRGLVRHERGRIRDWHYDALVENPAPTNTSAFLDAGPQDYRATVFGVLLQVRL